MPMVFCRNAEPLTENQDYYFLQDGVINFVERRGGGTRGGSSYRGRKGGNGPTKLPKRCLSECLSKFLKFAGLLSNIFGLCHLAKKL